MPYVCGKCGRAITMKELEVQSVKRCPYCNYRILYKIRPSIAKKVKAR